MKQKDFDPTKLYFEVRRQDSSGYKSLFMRVWDGDPDGYRTPRVDFTWQCNADELRWYAFSIEVDVSTYEAFRQVNTLVRKIFSRWTFKGSYGTRYQVEEPTPQMMIERLERKGAIHVVYDGRLSDHVKYINLKGEEYKGYRDDWKSYNGMMQGCLVACLARNDEEAIQLLTEEIQEYKDHYYYTEYAHAWLDDPKVLPMNSYSWSATPEQRPIEQLLNDPLR